MSELTILIIIGSVCILLSGCCGILYCTNCNINTIKPNNNTPYLINTQPSSITSLTLSEPPPYSAT